ncbi:MAG: hypothetical protein HC836_47510 [Richelia sp. RM2_1_2]|nr:hypothetical protein [Richelia sp. RM2_1_2]
MLKILLIILVLFLSKFAFYTPNYPDALIILFLSSLFLAFKFLEDKKEKSLSIDFESNIKKELEDVKGSISILKMGRGINGR